MKKILSLSPLFALILALPFLLAMGGSPKNSSYGIVDTTAVYTESKLGKVGFARIQDLQIKAEAELSLLEQRIDALEESEQDKLMRKQIEMQAAVYSLQHTLDQDQELVVAIIEKNFKEALQKVRTEKNMSIIFAKETLLSYEETDDVTKDVITMLETMEMNFPELPDVTLPEPVKIENIEVTE